MSNNIDRVLVSELVLFAENDSALYASCIKPVLSNLARKKMRGVYDARLAPKAYERTVKEAVAGYRKQFGAESMVLNAEEKKQAASELMSRHDEIVDDMFADMQEVAHLRKVWTKSAIRHAVTSAGSHHFDKETMRFFGETMDCYAVAVADDKEIIITRKKGRAGFKQWRFDPQTSEMHELRD